MKEYKLAIVGATGVVGQTLLQVLEEENLPISKYTFFASKRSAGSKLKFMNNIYTVQELTKESFKERFDFAIFSAGAGTAKEFAPYAVENGTIVIDNSSAFRMDENIPLVVPEVNSEEIQNNNGIIANPNCSTIQAVVALKPLDVKFEIKRIVYSTYQAVSGAGSKGIHDLENGIKNFTKNLNLDYEAIYNSNYNLEKFIYPIFNNCLPHIDDFTENGYTKEELKMINETRKILKRKNLPITATTVRVPVFNCHCESINVEFNKSFEIEQVREILKKSKGTVVVDNIEKNEYSIPTQVCGSNEVYISRIRRDYSVENGLNIWVVADNIRKGAATNAIQIMKKIIKK